jgi:ligand-binding sensor domain-containing protein/DNA-binding CsgD family transcriptional regulator
MFALTACHILFGQNTIGIPDIINYSKATYNAGPSNWDIAQDKKGVVYFANIEGLLSFDGAFWKTYCFPNKTMGRSVALGNDGKIYAGTDGDFGSFSPDENGRLGFHSFKPMLSERDQAFSGIWDIVSNGADVFFRSDTKIFRYNQGNVFVYAAPTEWKFLGKDDKLVIVQDSKAGLLKFSNDSWSPFLTQSALPRTSLVTGIIPFGKDSSLIVTMKDGLFVLSGNRVTSFKFKCANPFANELILSCAAVKKDWIAIGTQLNGCYIISKQGEVIQNFSRKEGLQNNCVVSLYLDRNQNLWMGLDNGIDFTAYNNGIKHIYPEQLNEGTGYSSIIYGNQLYLGTSNMLYKIPVSGQSDLSFNKGSFIPIPDTKGTSWGLFEVNGDLLVAHHEGAFRISKNSLSTLSKTSGYWNFIPFSNDFPSSLLIAGKYNGLDFFNYRSKTLSYRNSLPDFKEAARFTAVDKDNTIWIAHTYKGIYRIKLNEGTEPTIRLYDNKNGLPSAIGNKLFKIRGHIVIATEKGIYEYDSKKDAFVPAEWLKDFFGERNIRYLKEDKEGNIWFVADKMPGVVDFSNGKPHLIYFPELDGKLVSGFENINPVDKSNIIVGAEKGFYDINYEQYKKNHYLMQVSIRSVRASGRTDSLLFGGYSSDTHQLADRDETVPKVESKWNSFRFEYSSPLNENQNSVEYSYMLKGLDDTWSKWTKKTEKEYTNLPAGSYTFYVRARNYSGPQSQPTSYSFTILPPWYQTSWAYIFYVFIFGGVVFLIYRRQKYKFIAQQRRHEEEQKRLQYLHQLELDKSEKEIIALKNEKLQADIQTINTELASVAMHLLQKGELLTRIKDELTRLKNGNGNGNGNGNHDHNGEEFKKIIRILKEEDKLDKDWENFAVHFDNVHSDFIKELKYNYPNLSANELKLCAYLRMNLSSKEIAQLMNISVRGVEISRYRLRKKLMLATETNLFDFLMQFSLANHGQKV